MRASCLRIPQYISAHRHHPFRQVTPNLFCMRTNQAIPYDSSARDVRNQPIQRNLITINNSD